MTIDLKEAILTEKEDGIIHVHFTEGTEINLELQGRLFKAYDQICGNTKRPFLFTAAEYCSVTKEARENAIKMAETTPALANAVVAHSVAYKLIANFYFIVNKPLQPYKVFNDEEKAVEWLKTFL